MTIKQEYRQFLNDNFKGLQLRKGLFYCWDFGLRFNLQTGEKFNSTRQILDAEGNIIPHIGDTDTDEYFIEVLKRASTLFQTTFDNSDKSFFVLIEYKYKRRKIRFPNYSFRQIEGLKKKEINYSKVHRLYERNDKFDLRNIAIIKLTIDRVNYKNILAAISNTDFEPRQPRLDKDGVFTSKEIHFVNIDKKIIFNMYDDRGLDIIAANKETLRSIYKTYNEWILDYNRKQIDKLFE